MAAATVVSAYYPIRSKFEPGKYVEWMSKIWPNTSCALIFFTDPALVSQMEGLFAARPGPTKVIGVPFSELSAFQKLSPKLWLQTREDDPEKDKHSAELYAIWYEKKEFVLRAIELNPFNSEHFVWCDAGICRYPEWVPHIQAFPRREMIPADKMLVLRVGPFNEASHEKDAYGVRGDFKDCVSVGGGILATAAPTWKLWSKAYDAMLMRYYLAGRFVGKDQNIMASMILENPNLVVLIDPPPVMNTIQRWFYLLFFLAGVRVV
jgi:hypothetical protein